MGEAERGPVGIFELFGEAGTPFPISQRFRAGSSAGAKVHTRP